MVGKFNPIVLAVLLFCSLTIAKERNKAHKHEEETIDIDEPDGFMLDEPGQSEGSGMGGDTEDGGDDTDTDEWGSGTDAIIPGSGVGPDIVPVTKRPKPTRKTTTHPPLTACQQLKESSPPYKDSYVPRCNSHGVFEKTQCRGNKECWCVNPEGKIIAGTEKEGDSRWERPDCEGGSNLTPCVYMKVKHEWDMFLGAFIPRCNDIGEFETVQCRERECWCVDALGRIVEGTNTLQPDQPNCYPTAHTPVTELPIGTKKVESVYATPKKETPKNEVDNNISDEDDDEDSMEETEEITNQVGKEAESKGDPDTASAPAASIMGQPGILAGIIGGAVVGLLCAILLVMFIVYRMRKKDEGSYALDEPTKARGAYAYQKAPDREFYA